MMTFITEVQNIVNDTSIPRPIRNKLFNDMQSDIGLEINPQQIVLWQNLLWDVGFPVLNATECQRLALKSLKI
jgi:hypothetical protein